MDSRMDLWDQKRFGALVDNTITEGMALEGRMAPREETVESRARQYHSTVVAGKLRAAVQSATNRGGG
eukprot:3764518-Ditylum_brightwellii.AAC.1